MHGIGYFNLFVLGADMYKLLPMHPAAGYCFSTYMSQTSKNSIASSGSISKDCSKSLESFGFFNFTVATYASLHDWVNPNRIATMQGEGCELNISMN